MPLHKRNAIHDTGNYRGIHLTAQLSKAMERYIGKLFIPYVMTDRIVGANQFAYREKRGARDLLALLVSQWTHGMEIKRNSIYTALMYQVHLTGYGVTEWKPS